MGEARHDAAADQHDERDNDRKREAPAMRGVAGQMGLDMKDRIGDEQQRDDDQHPEISLVLAREDFARHGGAEQREKGAIDQRRQRPANLAR